MHPTTAPLAVAEGLFVMEGNTTRLIGTCCLSCNSTYFPQAVSCRNPRCHDKMIKECRIGSTGSLYSWTFQHYRPPAPFNMDEWTPYLIGLVDMPEGIRVLGMLDMPEEDASVGLSLYLDRFPLYTDKEGRTRYTYCFVPADRTERP